MTLVLVHGNPESDAIWQPLIAELGRDDVVCLSPPGFGAPVPAGFGATVADYRDWLITELEHFDAPIDLVGHDWGGGHTVNVAMSRPDLLRTWTTDVIGLFDPKYVWHNLAQMWQTPVQGEMVIASMMGGTPEKRADGMQKMGLPPDIAQRVAQAQNEEMGQCILSLYRSAAQPAMAELGKNLPAAAARPGLSILATGDQFVGDNQDLRRRCADRAGARTQVLEGLGHWWMLQDPAAAAKVLNDFLS